jgi:hypothetical protein
MYRGELEDYEEDYPDLVAFPAASIGFCTYAPSLTGSDITCSCPDCVSSPGGHYEKLDCNADLGDFVYRISGEAACAISLRGAEGTLGDYGGGGELPYGGGTCPPM